MERHRRLAYQGLLGLLLVAAWWPIAWLQIRPVSDYSFFPLWLGYVLTLDGLNVLRTGSSLWTRSRWRFLMLFVLSAGFWWFFEWVNKFVQNWHYVEPHPYSTLAYAVQATFSFSTVIPAVLEMTELLASFGLGERLPRPGAWHFTSLSTLLLEASGWLALVLVILEPRYFFPVAWLFLVLIVEPFNITTGQRSVGWYVERGEWAAIWNMMLAALVTGVFWETWNYYSMPKWYYTISFVGFWHVWEMPILGYGGYLPFGLEVFSIFALGFWLLERRPQHYVRATRQAEVAGRETKRDAVGASPAAREPQP